jgi:DNA primase
MRFPPEFLDEVRRRVSLVDVISRRVKLVRRGREHVGLCPFHSEKTPSFTVNEDKGFYHCFGCAAHGDVIRFLTENEGLHFTEAVERLAGQAGLEVPQLTPEQVKAYDKRTSLYDVMAAAAEWYQKQLSGDKGAAAREYIKGRGLGAQTVTDFGMGYAPDARSALKDALLSGKYPEDQLIEAGLLIKPEDNKASYDRFRGRIMFPITDVRDRVIAFGGRAMAADAKAKYLNSPETPLFHKGHNLYNLGPARKAAYEIGTVIVAEGYMDVIALHQGGFPNAVAPLGTAITEDQISLLWRMASEPVLCLDGDSAGHRAAIRTLERALPRLKPGYSLQFAMLPAGEDPDSLIANEGRGAFRKVLGDAISLAEMLWRTLTRGADISTPERRAGLEKKIFDALRPIEDQKVRSFYASEFRDRLNQMFWARRQEASGTRPGSSGARKPAFRKSKPGARLYGGGASNALKNSRLARASGSGPVGTAIEELVILTVLNHPQLLVAHLEIFLDFEIETRRLADLRAAIVEYAELGDGLDAEALKTHLIAEGFEAEHSRLMASDSFKSVWSAWPDANLADAEKGWIHTLNRHRFILALQRDKKAAEEDLSRNFTEEGVERLKAIQEEIQGADGNESDLEGYGLASGRSTTY